MCEVNNPLDKCGYAYKVYKNRIRKYMDPLTKTLQRLNDIPFPEDLSTEVVKGRENGSITEYPINLYENVVPVKANYFPH